jgi:hypothetical protein
MRRAGRRVGRTGWLVVLALSVAAGPARAIEPYLMTVGVLGGVGGPLDADDPDPGTSQRALELQLGLITEPRTILQLRLGKIDFDEADRIGDFLAPEIEYATLSGEYRFYRNFYDSGIFLGLGGYRLTGTSSGNDQTALGLTAGVTGEFEIVSRFSVLGQISGHYIDFDEAQLFATAMAGLSIKF